MSLCRVALRVSLVDFCTPVLLVRSLGLRDREGLSLSVLVGSEREGAGDGVVDLVASVPGGSSCPVRDRGLPGLSPSTSVWGPVKKFLREVLEKKNDKASPNCNSNLFYSKTLIVL